MMKLNKKEAESFSKIKINTEEDIRSVGKELLGLFDTSSILITLGPEGIAYFDKVTYKHNYLRKIDNPLYIYDVCGAGDVVFATLGYMMSCVDFNLNDIVQYSTKAGKLAVSKKGTSVITYNELFIGK